MGFSRRLSKGFLIALIFTLIPITAFSAQKITPGTACKIYNQNVTYQNKVYTCIKSGKKLVWSKGVSKSTATKSTPVPVPAPVEIPISIDNLDLKGVPQKAYDNVETVLKSRPRTNYAPTVILSPGVNQARVDQEISGLNRAIDLWQPYFLPDKFQVVYVVGGDEEWLENKSREMGLSSMVPPGDTWTIWMKKFSTCGFAMAGSGNGIPTFVQCLGRPYGGGNRQTGPHEYTHLFQEGLGRISNAYQIPWYTEGSASYFGWTLGFYPYQATSSERIDWLNNLYRNMGPEAKSDLSSKDLVKFKSRMGSLNRQVGNDRTSYWVGGLATEVLVALYGFDKFVDLTKNLVSTSSMSDLLMKTYGFNEDYFYEKLAPYVWAHIPN